MSSVLYHISDFLVRQQYLLVDAASTSYHFANIFKVCIWGFLQGVSREGVENAGTGSRDGKAWDKTSPVA
jgi:hypothetical protein